MISTNDFTIYGTNENKICGPLNLKIKENCITLIQGPNGAGKSSFLKYLVTAKGTHSGQLLLEHNNFNFSYLPQNYSNDFQLPASLKDILNAFEVKEKHLSSGLSPDLLWRTCSGGEKQRILLDIVLNRKADILLLDEPLNNLDEKSKEALWKSLQMILTTNIVRAIVIVSHEVPPFSEYEKVSLC